VLDFMWLLKSLQNDLTCTRVPWTPAPDGRAARLINEIVLAEESDETVPGRYESHFEWYLRAMREVGCDVGPIDRLLETLRSGGDPVHGLRLAGFPPAAEQFVRMTWSFLKTPLHVRGAVFFHSREDILPQMFMQVVQGLESQGLACSLFVRYLRRHIEVDRDTHGPFARRLLEGFYDGDLGRRREAEARAEDALNARLTLWNGIVAGISTSSDEPGTPLLDSDGRLMEMQSAGP
jgi:hypothetical protein